MPDPAPIPDGPQLLELERRSRQLGSGIGAAELAGTWRLEALWSKRLAEPQTSAAALLRQLQASLCIAAPQQPGEPPRLELRNSVQLGPLQLCFVGPGELRGRRPLLAFQFTRWHLSWGHRLLLQGALAAPAAQRQPFFALIACGQACHGGGPCRWLAARGRGGGLALWCQGP